MRRAIPERRRFLDRRVVPFQPAETSEDLTAHPGCSLRRRRSRLGARRDASGVARSRSSPYPGDFGRRALGSRKECGSFCTYASDFRLGATRGTVFMTYLPQEKNAIIPPGLQDAL